MVNDEVNNKAKNIEIKVAQYSPSPRGLFWISSYHSESPRGLTLQI
jgi:hypothetical protein